MFYFVHRDSKLVVTTIFLFRKEKQKYRTFIIRYFVIMNYSNAVILSDLGKYVSYSTRVFMYHNTVMFNRNWIVTLKFLLGNTNRRKITYT